MRFFITFLEGIISFISPCMLPLLPVYIGYFAGGQADKRRVLPRAIAFVVGFTLVFSLMGLFAGSLGILLRRNRQTVDIFCGILVILFGLSYLNVIRLPFLKGMRTAREAGSILSAFLFGVIYSINLTPCVGAFLGSALMLAASEGGALTGLSLLLVYSLGLGIPFVLSAVLLDRLRGAFSFIKRHYNIINIVCGIFLILVGITIALGKLDRILAIF